MIKDNMTYSNKTQTITLKRWLAIYVGVGVALGFLAWQCTKLAFETDAIVSSEIRQDKPSDVVTYLDKANQQSQVAINESLNLIERFFDNAGNNIPGFVDSAMSFRGKVWLMADQIPFTKQDRHTMFLKQSFEQHIFSSDELVQVVDQTVAHYLARLEQIENAMLTEMRNDLPDLPADSPLATLDSDVLFSTYRDAMKKVDMETHVTVSKELTKDVATLITAEILDQIAVRLGISSGILGVGTTSAIGTFGVGIATAVIVDVAVSWIWNWYASPKVKLAAKIQKQLEAIRRLIVDGIADSNGNVIGLKTRLQEYSQSRDDRRRETIMLFFNP